MNRNEKEQLAENLRQQVESVKSAFLMSFAGLKVNQATELRSKVRQGNSTYRVLKNRVAARALESTPLAPLREHLKGARALVFHPEEPVGLAKILTDFAKENPSLEFQAGLVDGRAISAAEFKALAALPSREILVARFMGALTSPLIGFQRVLTAPLRDFATVLDQIVKQKEGGKKEG